MKFTSHGIEYEVDNFGVIHQRNAQPYLYDASYCATYDTEAYRKGNDILQALRLGFTIAAHGCVPNSIQDNGYGNGAFMKFAKEIVSEVRGFDVTGIEVPGCEIVSNNEPADVYTFWDCLEHIPDMSFIEHIECETLVISLPWCHYNVKGQEWFDKEYIHRKPNEHLHHFNGQSLYDYMRSIGWWQSAISHHEDIIRKSKHNLPNILTMAFKR